MGDPRVDSQLLCTDCGLCCDGTFFGSVVIAPEETERLGRVGLRVLQSEGSCTMAQPCSALRGRLCDAYAERPTACATYECQLTKRVSAGTCSLEEARSKVAAARALLATIREGFEIPAGGSIWTTILSLEEPTTREGAVAALARYGPAIDAVGALVQLGAAEFEPSFAGGGKR
jgi:Fe-S-cluster containining protein